MKHVHRLTRRCVLREVFCSHNFVLRSRPIISVKTNYSKTLFLFQMEKKKIYRGTATSFGFKKPVTTNIISNSKTTTSHPNKPPPFPDKLTDSVESLDTTQNLRNGELLFKIWVQKLLIKQKLYTRIIHMFEISIVSSCNWKYPHGNSSSLAPITMHNNLFPNSLKIASSEETVSFIN